MGIMVAVGGIETVEAHGSDKEAGMGEMDTIIMNQKVWQAYSAALAKYDSKLAETPEENRQMRAALEAAYIALRIRKTGR